jgi:hypothetical protein
LGGSQQQRVSIANNLPLLAQNHWHRPLHRPDRLRAERIFLFYLKGGAAVTDTAYSILENVFGTELVAASATRWGGTVGVGWEYGFAPNWSAGIEYDHLFMGHRNNSFTSTNVNLVNFLNSRISQDVGHGHSAHQLPLRLGHQPGRRVLTSSCYDISANSAGRNAGLFVGGYVS